jgi:S-layer homology domain
MHRDRWIPLRIAALAALLTFASGRTAGASPNWDAFGPGDQEHWISGSDLASQAGTPWHKIGQGSWTPPVADVGFAAVNLPVGARVTEMRCYLFDSSAADDAFVTLERRHYDRATFDIDIDTLATIQTAGTPGRVILAVPLDETIEYRTDTTDDDYQLNVSINASSALQIYGCRLVFHRQVSPPPATPAFNDVPTDHPFFQFVEALAKSGITGGCSATPPLYCPNQPLTRGQMAVFLSKALGLQWP